MRRFVYMLLIVISMKKIMDKNKINKISIYILLYLITFQIIFSVFILTPNNDYQFPILRGIIIFFSSILLGKYFLYMFISPWYDVSVAISNAKNYFKIKKYKPLVSVMIPAWNEEIGILTTVRSLLKSTYRNIELVIVNDGSTDNSDNLIKAFIEKYNSKKSGVKKSIEIIYNYKHNEGKGAALNTAIELSKGDILLSIDADCIVCKNTIEKFVSYFANPEVMAAVGNVKVGNTNTLIGVIQYLEFLFSFYFKKADSIMNSIYIIGGAAGAFRRETFEKVGVYNTKNITEDIELSVRIQSAGLKIVYAADALVYTEGADEVQGLLNQRLRWKRGRFETFNQNLDLFFSFQKHHRKILSWIILPFSYFGELQLSLEIFFLTFLYIYSYLINDFSSFISGVIVVSTMFFVQMFFDDKETKKGLSFYILLPIGWLLFYFVTFVEFNALVKSIWGMVRRREVKWQKWARKGVMD